MKFILQLDVMDGMKSQYHDRIEADDLVELLAKFGHMASRILSEERRLEKLRLSDDDIPF